MKILPFTRLIATTALALSLASCTVGPDYKKPGLHLPFSWFSANKQAAAPDPRVAVEQDWWKNFNDPVLNELIARAVAGNYDLKIAQSRIAAARANLGAASAADLPSISAAGTAERQRNQITFPGGPSPGINLAKPFNTFQPGFDASWEIDIFGGGRRQKEAARANVESAEAARDEARVSLLAEVARTYIAARQYQAQLAVTRDIMTAEKKTVGIADELYKAGNTAAIDVTRAQSRLDDAAADIPLYQNLQAQAEYSLDVLLGEPPGGAHELIAKVAPIPAVSSKLVLAAPATVIADRPDIRQAERALAAATAQQGVAIANMFPRVSLSGFLGFLSSDAGTLVKRSNVSWREIGGVSWPLLDFGKIEAGIDLADAEQQEALTVYKKSVITALSDVESAVVAYKKEQEHLRALEKVVAGDRHTLDITQARYKQGLTNFLDVLDAQRTIYNSQSRLTEARGELSQKLIAAYKSLGGGWYKEPAPDHIKAAKS